jgi:phage terminase large subunit-like protein
MPWQSHAAHLGLEMVENSDGILVPAYREVICTVMRQSGKSTLLFSLFAHRSTMWASLPQRCVYTAQDGQAARKKLIEDMGPMYQESKLFTRLVQRVFKGVGNEGIDFKTGSTIRTIGSSEAAGHGMTSTGLAGIDESFADVDFRREQALQPSMATVADAQTWNVSTAGTERSVYLRKKIDDGRAAVADGSDRGLAYIEYSIPDDEDCDDPEVWWRYMPALGWTIGEDVVRHARQTMPDGEWRRSFGNQDRKSVV